MEAEYTPAQSICLIDIMDRQLEGCCREGLRHGVACVATIRRSRHCRVLLQSRQSRCVGGIVYGDIASSIQAPGCRDTLHVMGHGIDRCDWTTLGLDEQKENWDIVNTLRKFLSINGVLTASPGQPIDKKQKDFILDFLFKII